MGFVSGKRAGKLNSAFAEMPAFKRILLKLAGRRYDQFAAGKNQKYYFIFVHEDGPGLERISGIFFRKPHSSVRG